MGHETPWILTYSGKRFFPFDPRMDDIDIVDIAHALSNLCRFTGHTLSFYSVAEHCVRMSKVGPQYLALPLLLHDASEAYLSDLSRPVKHNSLLQGYRDAERHLMDCIELKFRLPVGAFQDPLIKHIDNRMLMTERRDLLPTTPDNWDVSEDAFPFVVTPVSPEVAEKMFLARYAELKGQMQDSCQGSQPSRMSSPLPVGNEYAH
jgi:hypothetical protein